MSNEQRQEQQKIPLEVANAELGARLQFTENRLIAMAAVAYNLQLKCDELAKSLAERSEEIVALHASLDVAGNSQNIAEEGE